MADLIVFVRRHVATIYLVEAAVMIGLAVLGAFDSAVI